MAKYAEVYQEIQDEFDSVIISTNLERYGVNIKVLANDKQKGKVINVYKSNDFVKYLTKEDIILVVNQLVFEKLEPLQRVMVIEEALASIIYNDDKDTITIKKGDVHTYSGVLKKYTYERYEVLQESIRTIYAVLAGEDSDETEA